MESTSGQSFSLQAHGAISSMVPGEDERGKSRPDLCTIHRELLPAYSSVAQCLSGDVDGQ